MENVGENKEFGIASISDVTIHFSNSSGLTSADDTATDKYVDTQVVATKYHLRADQTLLLKGVNNRTFTDPATVIVDKGHKEDYKTPFVNKLVIRTTVANTNVKVRYF